MATLDTATPLSIIEATIADLASALAQGHTNSVELTAKHLIRISKYDRRSTTLNAIPIINENAFEAAQAADERRVQGVSCNPLNGIPCTIKDSYKIKGMTVASGSHAFKDLIANEDAFTVQKIKEAGAVILGRTNMPPMAAGGMQRGVYGRAESPYNAEYLTAAFASGSSNGSATATAASFGVFGMGEETISSGRSPASNNGLVAYTPSRGLISIRGNWPLFPTCDTVVPHTRSVDDMLALLDVIVAEDKQTSCDFWRGQPYVKLPSVGSVRPEDFRSLASQDALRGKRIGVPKMYIGGTDCSPTARPVFTRKSVVDLWNNTRKVLEELGATVEEVDFPVVTKFESPDGKTSSTEESTAPPHHNEVDMCKLMAYAWDDFLVNNGDAKVANTLAAVDSATIFPPPPGSLRDRYDPNDPLGRHAEVVAQVANGRSPIYEIPDMGKALRNLEAKRKADFEDWLDTLGLDAVVWPCNGDVGKADAETNEVSAIKAWRNGVLYSNGNCAIRQLGIPTVSVPMGVMADTKMPVSLTFASKAYDDNDLLRYSYAYEKASRLRQAPPRTPELPTDAIVLTPKQDVAESKTSGPPQLEVDVKLALSSVGAPQLTISGCVKPEEVREMRVYVDGDEVRAMSIAQDGTWSSHAEVITHWTGQREVEESTNCKKALVLVVATGRNGRSSGKMVFV